ncbi:MAG: SDR family oxidoreductase [Actinobacteria bacterium]|nr:SDR family oxidoreductase [Actinomycetota bacterium]
MTADGSADRRVSVVTGGGRGIGAAIAEALGARGDHVVVVDPMVALDGTAGEVDGSPSVVDRIVAAGGSAASSDASVADEGAMAALLGGLVDERGRLDVVVNAAGITRPTSYGRGTDEDWAAVLSVHLGGYVAVLRAALPLMVAAGRGHVLGVTSGSGWRRADAGAYGCAKRAVAALTWQLGPLLPEGVVLNAISPIAVTRMVEAALRRADHAKGSAPRKAGSGGLSLGNMPQPEDLAPLVAHLVGDEFDAFRGQVVFTGGSEAALVSPPALVEAVHEPVSSESAAVLAAVTAGALVPAESAQGTAGGGNPRFDEVYSAGAVVPAADVSSCAVACDDPAQARALVGALERRGVRTVSVSVAAASSTGDVEAALRGADQDLGGLDAVVVHLAAPVPADRSTDSTGSWEEVLADHVGLPDRIAAATVWSRAAALAVGPDRPVRLVSVVDASTPAGRSHVQAMTQLSRAARGPVTDLVVGLEGASPPWTAEVAAHLVAGADVASLGGAELVAGDGWLGLRRHPRPAGGVVLGSATPPPWLDRVLAEMAGRP